MMPVSLFQKGALSTIGTGLVLLGASTASQAATLSFDDLSTANSQNVAEYMPNDYAGFQWDNFAYDSTPPPQSGFTTGVVSPSTMIFNIFGEAASISRKTAFDFNSVYLTAAWRTGLSVLVEGYSGTAQKYTQTLTLNPEHPTLFTFNFLNVDRVRFSATGGVNLHPSDSDGTHFVLDNLTYNPNPATPAQAVPEPTTMLGLGLAGAGLVAARRRSQAARGKV